MLQRTVVEIPKTMTAHMMPWSLKQARDVRRDEHSELRQIRTI